MLADDLPGGCFFPFRRTSGQRGAAVRARLDRPAGHAAGNTLPCLDDGRDWRPSADSRRPLWHGTADDREPTIWRAKCLKNNCRKQ